MKIQIRNQVFETNSSSTHSLCMISKNIMEEWKSGELYYLPENKSFITKEEYEDLHKGKPVYNSWGSVPLTMEQYFDGEWCTYMYETFRESYTTDNNEVIYAFGHHGYNG